MHITLKAPYTNFSKPQISTLTGFLLFAGVAYCVKQYKHPLLSVFFKAWQNPRPKPCENSFSTIDKKTASSAPNEKICFSIDEKKSLAQRIWYHESKNCVQCLTFWSRHEAFPSLGIAHFIWHPENCSSSIDQTFNLFIEYMIEKKEPIPDWLKENYLHCPWKDRKAFYREINSKKMQELRNFLFNSSTQQVDFILLKHQEFIHKVNQALLKKELSLEEHQKILKHHEWMSQSTEGAFALIDYLNFKGDGFYLLKSYQYHGFGLKQVLLDMSVENPKQAVKCFVESAEKLLTQRVKLSPDPKKEANWLPGWKNRLKTYCGVFLKDLTHECFTSIRDMDF